MTAGFADEHPTPPEDTSSVAGVEQTGDYGEGKHWEHDEHPDESVTKQDAESMPPVAQRKPSFLQSIFRLIWPSIEPNELTSRLEELDTAIAHHPEAGVNYVLRGELYLKTRRYEDAFSDFQRALEIVIDEVENNNWGIVAQALRDRAQRGLQQAERHLVTTNNSGGENLNG